MNKLIVVFSLMLFLFNPLLYPAQDKVMAIINNEVITKAELDMYIKLLKLQLSQDGWDNFNMSEKKALESLIEDRLIIQEAKNKEIKIDDREIEARLKEIKRQFRSEEEFSEFLSSQGLNLTELKERFKEQLLSAKIISMEVRSRILISPREITDYYQKHIDEFIVPESVQVDSISVSDEKLAKEVYQKLKDGSDFAQMQNEYSNSSSLDKISRGQLRKDLEDFIFGLKVGEVCEPKEIEGFFYIFLVQNKFPPAKKELSEVQKDISDLIFEMKFSLRMKEWLNKLKDESYIVVKDE